MLPIPFGMTGFTLKRIGQADTDRTTYGTLETPIVKKYGVPLQGQVYVVGAEVTAERANNMRATGTAGNAGGDSERRNPNLT